MIFTPLKGDDLNVYCDENYRLVQCCGGHIVFSYAKKGKGMTAHFASDRIGLRHVKPAIHSFCEWLFRNYEWCKVIFAVIDKKRMNIIGLVKKCGFDYLISDSASDIYARYR
jgi:hypothetical protein